MKFKLDENVPHKLAPELRRHGHDADTVKDEGLTGFDDAVLRRVAADEGRCLITFDQDFADLRTLTPDTPGIIFMRLAYQDAPTVLGIFAHLMPRLSETSLRGCLWIVENDRVRVRKAFAR